MSIFNAVVRKVKCFNLRAGEEEGCVLRNKGWGMGRNMQIEAALESRR